MSKFSLSVFFNSATADVRGTKKKLELHNTGDDEYTVFIHEGEYVAENGVFTKEELRALYNILSTN